MKTRRKRAARSSAGRSFRIGQSTFVVLSFPAPPRSADRLAVLSPAERAIARAVAEGLTNRAIAERRGRTERTIANQIHAIYKKLGIEARVELVRLVLDGATRD